MSEEKSKDVFEKIALVEEAFKIAFGDSVWVETKTVKAGGTSSNVYVPKKFGGHPVTIIIWDKMNPYLEEEVDTNGRRNNGEQLGESGKEESVPGTELPPKCEEKL